jgi:hypothetical protein
MSNDITVYWASPAIPKGNINTPLNFNFAEPTSVLNMLRDNKAKASQPQSSFACPAHNSMLKNVYSVNATENYTFDLEKVHSTTNWPWFNRPYDFVSPRQSSLEGYSDIEPTYSWLFFASEPVVARFTAPYLPAVSPADGAMLVCGEFDIGQWYRPFVLNYMVPKHTPYLTIIKNNPLFFVEFKTDKNIVFKQYQVNETLNLYSNRCLRSPVEVGRSYTLETRYQWMNETITAKAIIEEIEGSLVK